MGIQLTIVHRSEAAKDQDTLVACSILDLLKGTLCYMGKFINTPRVNVRA